MNIRFITNNGNKDSAIFATSSAVGLPITNTQNENRAKRWRSLDDPMDSPPADGLVQVITVVTAITIDGLGGIVLSNTNLTVDADVTVALKDGVSTVDTLPMECLGLNFDGTTTWVLWFDNGPIDQWEISIDDTGNPAGYIDIVQIIGGPYFTVRYNMAAGAEIEYQEDIEHKITKGKTPRSFGTGVIRREISIDLPLVVAEDRAALLDAMLATGMRDSLFVSMYPGEGGSIERNHQFVAKRLNNIATAHQTNQLWRQGLQFIEV